MRKVFINNILFFVPEMQNDNQLYLYCVCCKTLSLWNKNVVIWWCWVKMAKLMNLKHLKLNHLQIMKNNEEDDTTLNNFYWNDQLCRQMPTILYHHLLPAKQTKFAIKKNCLQWNKPWSNCFYCYIFVGL